MEVIAGRNVGASAPTDNKFLLFRLLIRVHNAFLHVSNKHGLYPNAVYPVAPPEGSITSTRPYHVLLLSKAKEIALAALAAGIVRPPPQPTGV